MPRRPMSVTLVLADDNDAILGHDELGGPGGTIRIGVGQPGRRGSVWRIWSNPTADDVYIAARVLAGIQKFSLHASGDWRHQWANKDVAKRFGAESRVIDQWQRPPGIGAGWTRGLTIWTPAEDVVEVPEDAEKADDIVWLPAAETGGLTAIHVVVAKPDHGIVRLERTRPVAGYVLSSGAVVLALVTSETRTDEQREWLDEHRMRIKVVIGEDAGHGGLRLTLFGQHDDGTRAVWDLSALHSVADE